MSREYIAKALKRLRDQSGLTANQVGVLVGKSGKTVNAWENGRGQPDAEILMQLCDIYRVNDILAEFRESPSISQITESKIEKSPAISDEALMIAERFDSLSDTNKFVVRTLVLNMSDNNDLLSGRSLILKAARDGALTMEFITREEEKTRAAALENLPSVESK